jgi:hypothetical protein
VDPAPSGRGEAVVADSKRQILPLEMGFESDQRLPQNAIRWQFVSGNKHLRSEDNKD